MLFHKMFQYSRPKIRRKTNSQEQKRQQLVADTGAYIRQIQAEPEWCAEMYAANYDQLLATMDLDDDILIASVSVVHVQDGKVKLDPEASLKWSSKIRFGNGDNWTEVCSDMANEGLTWVFCHQVEVDESQLDEKFLRNFKREFGATKLRQFLKMSNRTIATIWSMDGPRFTMIANKDGLPKEHDMADALRHAMEVNVSFQDREVHFKEYMVHSVEYPIFIDHYAQPQLGYDHEVFGQCDLYEFDKNLLPVVRLVGGTDIEG